MKTVVDYAASGLNTCIILGDYKKCQYVKYVKIFSPIHMFSPYNGMPFVALDENAKTSTAKIF